MKWIKNIVNNAYSFSIVTKLFSVITGLLYAILFSRYLGAELRGVASLISTYAELIMLFLCLGINETYAYFKKNMIRTNLFDEFINLVVGLFIVYAGVSIILGYIFRDNYMICVVGILVPLLMVTRQFNYVVLLENPKLRNIAHMGLDLFDIIFLILLIILTEANLYYCIFFLILKNLMALLISFINLKKTILSIHPTLKNIWTYLKFGFVPMITIIFMEINYRVDIFMLNGMNISNAEIGIYSLGVMLAQRLWMIPDALKDILTSNLAKGKDEKEVCKVTRISVLITLICIGMMVVLGKPLITLLFGEEYGNAYRVFLIISLGVVGMVFYKMIYAFNVVNGCISANFVFLFLAAMLNIMLNYLLIPKLAMEGAAIASLVSYTFCGMCYLFYFLRVTRINIIEVLCVKKTDLLWLLKLGGKD